MDDNRIIKKKEQTNIEIAADEIKIIIEIKITQTRMILYIYINISFTLRASNDEEID